MRSGSANLVRLAALTAAVLLAAAALWTYTGRSDSSGGGSAGESSQGLADFSVPGASTKGDDGSSRGGRHADRHGAAKTKPVSSGPGSPITRVISGPLALGGRSFPPEAPAQTVKTTPVKTSPVSQERRPPTARPRTLPPRRAPKRRGGPANPAPAPQPAPKQAPSTGPPTGGAPSTPGATPTEPGATPTEPGGTPTDPGTTPAPVPAADPDAGLDDTPAGGLDQTDLGEPIDETPDAEAPTTPPAGGAA
jgi:hypothetical protein